MESSGQRLFSIVHEQQENKWRAKFHAAIYFLD